MVDALDSKSCVLKRRAGSSPASGTISMNFFSKIAVMAISFGAASCSSDVYNTWKSLPISSDTNLDLLEEQVAADPAQWQAVYDFLKGNDLAALSTGRHEIVPGGAFVNVTEYDSKVDGVFEAHKDYIDVQIIVSGEEDIHVGNLEDALDCTMEYNKDKDCVLFASATEFRTLAADPSIWFIFFPSDLHRPGVAKSGVPSHVKKIIVKIPVR